MKTSKNSLGFTLVEELTVISLILFMTCIGAPAMSTMLDSNRQANQMNILAGHLRMVRSKAIFDHKNMLICKSKDGEYCDKKSDWNDGWITFSDRNNNKKRDPEEALIISQGKLADSTKIIYGSFGGSKNYVRFYSQGYSHTNGTFLFCSSRGIEYTKAIIISKTGRVRNEDKPTKRQRKKCQPYVS